MISGIKCFTRLPKFKFLAKFPLFVHVILKTSYKKRNKNLLESDAQNYFNRKSVAAALFK